MEVISPQPWERNIVRYGPEDGNDARQRNQPVLLEGEFARGVMLDEAIPRVVAVSVILHRKKRSQTHRDRRTSERNWEFELRVEGILGAIFGRMTGDTFPPKLVPTKMQDPPRE